MRLNKFLLLAIGTLIGASIFLSAGAAAQPTLAEAIAEVLPTSPRVQAETSRLDGHRATLLEARAAGRPIIEAAAAFDVANGSFDPGRDGEALIGSVFGGMGDGMMDGGGQDLSFAGDGTTTGLQAQVSVVQPVFTGFRIKNGVLAARGQLDAATANREAVLQSEALRLAEAHLSVITAASQVELVETSAVRLATAARAAQLAFESGQGTRTDTALAEARVASSDARRASAAAQSLAAQANYAALAGRPPAAIRLEGSALTVPATVDELLALALDQHPQVAAASAQATAAAFALRQAKGARAPQIQVRGAVSYAENTFFEGDQNQNASLTAELAMPIYRGGALGAQVQRAAAEARAAKFALTEVRRGVEAEARAAFAQLRAARLGAASARQEVSAAELAYRGVVLERDVGQRTVLDVLAVEESLLSARLFLVEAQRNEVLASFRVNAAAGSLLRQLPLPREMTTQEAAASE